jgi:hypothetical protein
MNGLPVEPGKSPGVAEGNGAYLAVGCCAKSGIITTEEFTPGKQAHMHFEANNHFIFSCSGHSQFGWAKIAHFNVPGIRPVLKANTPNARRTGY